MSTSRRTFIATATAASIAAAVANPAGASPAVNNYPKMIHHVFFWLKNPGSREDLESLLKGLRTLAGIPSVRGVHIGVPASSEKRDVVDNSYSASELLFFDDTAGEKEYQVHPIHQKFIADCSHLWSKVVVYDALAV